MQSEGTIALHRYFPASHCRIYNLYTLQRLNNIIHCPRCDCLSALALAASTLLPSASANFDFYRVKSIKPYAQGGNSLGWMIFAAEPSCDTVFKGAMTNGWWESSNGVSGDKYGSRREGDRCRAQSSPSDVDIWR